MASPHRRAHRRSERCERQCQIVFALIDTAPDELPVAYVVHPQIATSEERRSPQAPNSDETFQSGAPHQCTPRTSEVCASRRELSSPSLIVSWTARSSQRSAERCPPSPPTISMACCCSLSMRCWTRTLDWKQVHQLHHVHNRTYQTYLAPATLGADRQ